MWFDSYLWLPRRGMLWPLQLCNHSAKMNHIFSGDWPPGVTAKALSDLCCESWWFTAVTTTSNSQTGGWLWTPLMHSTLKIPDSSLSDCGKWCQENLSCSYLLTKEMTGCSEVQTAGRLLIPVSLLCGVYGVFLDQRSDGLINFKRLCIQFFCLFFFHVL